MTPRKRLRYSEHSRTESLTRTEAKGMLTVDDYGAIRRAHRDGMPIKRIALEFEHSRNLLGADDLKQLPHQGSIFCFRNLGQSQWHGYILPTAMPFFPIFLRSYLRRGQNFALSTTSIQPSGWSHSSVTRFTDFMNAPGQAAIRAIDRLLWNAPGPTCFIWNTSTRSGGKSPHGCNWSRRVTEVGKYSGRDGRGGSLLTAMIWSHSVIPGSCLYADPIRHSWSSTTVNRSNRAFSRSTSLITPSTQKYNSSTSSGNLGSNQPSLSFTRSQILG